MRTRGLLSVERALNLMTARNEFEAQLYSPREGLRSPQAKHSHTWLCCKWCSCEPPVDSSHGCPFGLCKLHPPREFVSQNDALDGKERSKDYPLLQGGSAC